MAGQGGGNRPNPQQRNRDRAEQMNPQHQRGQAAQDNRADQKNPNNQKYDKARQGNG